MMFRRDVFALLCAAMVIGVVPLVSAQEETPPGDWQALTSEERQARRDAARERWESMSEEERAAARAERGARQDERFDQARQRWESMSEEERAAARAERDARRE